MKAYWPCLVAAGWLALGVAVADDTPAAATTTLVQSQAAARGSFAVTVEAYGSAMPATDAGMTLSVQAEGRIARIMVSAGAPVRAGQALIEFQLSASASSAWQQARSALDLATQERARTARLLQQQLATSDQLAQADKAESDARAALAALRQEGGGTPRQIIVAPFDGVVANIAVAQGERLPPGAPLATLSRSGGLVVSVGIEPAQRTAIKAGQPVRLTPLIDGEPVLQGTVLRIGHVLNAKTRLVDADIAVAGDPLLGEAFKAEIRVGELTGWLVPRDAVLSDGQGSYLYQMAGGKARRIGVSPLGGDDRTSVVEGPLDPKARLVIQGNYQLQDGGAVREAVPTGESMGEPPAGGPEGSGQTAGGS